MDKVSMNSLIFNLSSSWRGNLEMATFKRPKFPTSQGSKVKNIFERYGLMNKLLLSSFLIAFCNPALESLTSFKEENSYRSSHAVLPCCSLLHLPEELLLDILSFSSIRDLGRISAASSLFRRLANDPSLWKTLLKQRGAVEYTISPSLQHQYRHAPQYLIRHSVPLIQEVILEALPRGALSLTLSLPNLNWIECGPAGGCFKLVCPIPPLAEKTTSYSLSNSFDLLEPSNGIINGLLKLRGNDLRFVHGFLFKPTHYGELNPNQRTISAHQVTTKMRLVLCPIQGEKYVQAVSTPVREF